MKWLKEIYHVWTSEIRLVFRDMGVVIFFFLLPLAYPIVYTLIYNPEVLREIPVAVVDDCRTSGSRELTRQIDATSAADVIGIASDMAEAKRWMAEKKCYAVVQIPEDYSRRIMRHDISKVPVFMDMSLLLRYRTIGFALTDIQLDKGTELRAELMDTYGLESSSIGQTPIENAAFFLGDNEQGFASFVMPGIVILILQQSMVLGIAMLAGGTAERRRRNGGIDPLEVKAGASASVIGKVLCYAFLYIPGTIYVMHYIPEMFSLPHVGSPLQYLPFIFPMLLASALFGLIIGHLIKEREMSFIAVVFTSVLFLFISGLTWPRYAMNPFWTFVGDCIPAVSGVEGFIRINSNGASLADNSTPYLRMWLLTGVYFVIATAMLMWDRRKQKA